METKTKSSDSDNTTGWFVESDNGQIWFITYDAVKIDYAQDTTDYWLLYGPITFKETYDRTTHTDVLSWFHEQISWSDVKRLGVMVKDSSQEDIDRMKEFFFGRGSRPHECVINKE